jgi:transcriptional regulator with XRE-family HTH domain
LTKNDLAERTGIAKSTIYHWVNGVHSPNVPSILKLCEVMELTPNQLLGVEDTQYARPVFSRLKALQKAVTKNGLYDSGKLDAIANALLNKSPALASLLRDTARAVYNLELAVKPNKRQPDEQDEQLTLFPHNPA